MSTWKCIMSASAEELASVLILYTKFFTVCTLFWKYGLWKAVLYSVGWIVLSSLFPQPWYKGPTKIFELTEAAFKDKVLKSKSRFGSAKITELSSDDESAKDDPKYWIVMLYANWSVACLNFEAVLAKLSMQYDAPHIKFGQVDIDIYSNMAEEFGVSKDPASFDLPTLVLFKNGREIRRLPELTVTKDGSKSTTTDVAKDTITRLGWSKKPATVIEAFQLEKIAKEKVKISS
ncbi:thioredoxin-like protein [Pilobolus umbonatus]|nr:thioredoxin-like protein [Pilobolus umbonatus]